MRITAARAAALGACLALAAIAACKGKLPLLLWHGGGLTGVTYETKPDGGEGWLTYFIRKGWDAYISDAMERGRAGFRGPHRSDCRPDGAAVNGRNGPLPPPVSRLTGLRDRAHLYSRV